MYSRAVYGCSPRKNGDKEQEDHVDRVKKITTRIRFIDKELFIVAKVMIIEYVKQTLEIRIKRLRL